MTRLTAEEKERVIEAAALIERDKCDFSCNALTHIFGGLDDMSRRYSRFYRRDHSRAWLGEIPEPNKHLRVMLLLWFAEVMGSQDE